MNCCLEFESSRGHHSCSFLMHVGWGIELSLGLVRCFKVLACPEEVKERHFSLSNHFAQLIYGNFMHSLFVIRHHLGFYLFIYYYSVFT